jgi:hypothetical protein
MSQMRRDGIFFNPAHLVWPRSWRSGDPNGLVAFVGRPLSRNQRSPHQALRVLWRLTAS